MKVTSCLYLVIGQDAGEVRVWMTSYIDHWKRRKCLYEPTALILVDISESIVYAGIDGQQRGWRRHVQAMRPETVILLRGWSEVQGVGLELDLMKATGANVIFAEPFGVIDG